MRASGLMAGAGLLAACKQVSTAPPVDTGTSSMPPMTHPPIAEETGDLRIYEWLGYGDGSYGDDVLWAEYKDKGYPAPKFIKTFDDDSGYTKVALGGTDFDIVHPCGYRFQDWVDLTNDDGSPVLQPWDTSLIPNFPDLNPSLQTRGNFNGEQYFIGADWGFAAPMYRADKIQPDATWGAIFDEAYGGKISWWDSLNMFIPAALVLGIAEPYDMTDEELDQTTDFLIEKVPLVRTFWVDDPTPDLVSGEVDIAYSWQNHWWAALDYGSGSKNAVDAVYMEPKEGRISWLCGFALFADTENYRHAHEYVDAWMSTASADWLIDNYAYGHSNTEVDLEEVNKDLVEQFSLDDPSILQEPNSVPEVPYPRRDLYNDRWLEVKASAG